MTRQRKRREWNKSTRSKHVRGLTPSPWDTGYSQCCAFVRMSDYISCVCVSATAGNSIQPLNKEIHTNTGRWCNTLLGCVTQGWSAVLGGELGGLQCARLNWWPEHFCMSPLHMHQSPSVLDHAVLLSAKHKDSWLMWLIFHQLHTLNQPDWACVSE